MKIGVTGVTGRMSQAIARLVIEDNLLDLSAGLTREGSLNEGRDFSQMLGCEEGHSKIISNIDEFVKNSDGIIDFSAPALSLQIAKKCAQYGKVLVCGTTGFSEEEKQEFVANAEKCVIIWSSNMSLGVNLLMNLSEKVAGILHDDFDVEIVEMHHKNKVDAPSGTALSLGAAVAKGRNVDLQEVGQMARVGKNNPRQKSEIGFATLRGGDVIGDHSVIFAGDGERIELTHKATNRDVFAKGALRAAIWGSAKEPGFYSMRDVLS